ncbi:MAG: hypothetical protein AAFU85_03265, partial [Planctomycetota bacterium]
KAKALLNRGITYGQQGAVERKLADYSAVLEMDDAPADQKAKALLNRGITYGQQGAVERKLADYSAVIKMDGAPSDQKAAALVSRGLTYAQQGEVERELADYSAVVEMADAPADQKSRALFNRGAQAWRDGDFKRSFADFDSIATMPNVPDILRTLALFAIVEAMVDYCSQDEVISALRRAFEDGDSKTDGYGGTPNDLLRMVLRRSPEEWAQYISRIAPLYVERGVAEKLGQGVTQSIQSLDEGGFSRSQIEAWNSAWQQAGVGCDDLEIPLRCLDAAVEVINSDPPTDRPLFRLPLEIRGLIRPLLSRTLDEK